MGLITQPVNTALWASPKDSKNCYYLFMLSKILAVIFGGVSLFTLTAISVDMQTSRSSLGVKIQTSRNVKTRVDFCRRSLAIFPWCRNDVLFQPSYCHVHHQYNDVILHSNVDCLLYENLPHATKSPSTGTRKYLPRRNKRRRNFAERRMIQKDSV